MSHRSPVARSLAPLLHPRTAAWKAVVMYEAGQFMNTMSTLEYNTPTLTQEYEYTGVVLLMSMSTRESGYS